MDLMMNSHLTEKETNLINEISHLEQAIKDIAPKMSAALKTYHKLRDKHSNLVSEHRERQKELKILNDQITRLAPPKTDKRSLNNDTKQLKNKIAKLTEEEKALLRGLLLGE